jgi:hypothetical protein
MHRLSKYRTPAMKNPLRMLRIGAMATMAITMLCVSAQAQAPLDIRVALVIGNSAYAGAPLLNPANDARAMGEALRRLGFTVVELRDGNKQQMSDAIAKVQESLKGKQGVGILYYAGHGLQLDWRNYMVPVNANLSKASDVPEQTIDISSVIDAFKSAGNRMNILVLDACRDNPFSNTATGKGLAQLDAPPGTFLAYATAPGNVAEDGDLKTGNGLYTQYLLEELKKPTAGIEDVFKRVRLQVRLKSEGRQIPWESTSLEEDFYFAKGKVPAKKGEPLDEAAFERESGLWDKTKRANTVDAFVTYLSQYPGGLFSEFAQAKLDRLQKPLVAPKFKAGDALANDSTTERFKVGDVYEYRVNASGPSSSGVSSRRQKVTAIHDDLVEINGGNRTLDLLGNTQSVRDHTWRDAQFFPAQYQPGKKWTLRAYIETDKRDDTVFLDARIGAREKISVSAGSFDVYRVDISGLGTEGHRYNWTFWMNPNYGMPIKSLVTVHNPKGKMRKSEQSELVTLNAPR